MTTQQKPPASQRYAQQIQALTSTDQQAKPQGWRLSPLAVKAFICGDKKLDIPRKFFGDDALIDRCIVGLMSNRGLLLVGEPGTAKSMLSELLSTAISGGSELTIQGTAGTTEDQIKYSWNYAQLLADGPSEKALVAAPLYLGMSSGRIVRFEEITRCAQEVQDTMISLLSDKVLHVPELGESHSLYATPGFNVIATANLRDRGVNEMSSALKRRFNFETVQPINDAEFEVKLVTQQAEELLAQHGCEIQLNQDVTELLVTTFQELRQGRTQEGGTIDSLSTVMSTAEAVSVMYSAALDATYFNNGQLTPKQVLRQLTGTVLKDEPEDAKKVKQYFDIVVKQRSRGLGGKASLWKAFYNARNELPL